MSATEVDERDEGPDQEPSNRVFRRTCRHAIQVLGGLGAGLAILLAFAGWKLHDGPVSLSFLTPTLERVLNRPDHPVSVKLGDTILTWAGWDRALDVLLTDVQAFDREGRSVATLPEVSIGLSAKALFEGSVALRSLDVRGAKLQVRRSVDGTFVLAFQSGNDADGEQSDVDLANALLAGFLAEETPEKPMTYLNRIEITDAEVELIDERLGLTWDTTDTDFLLTRTERGLLADADLLLDMDGATGHAAVSALYDVAQEQLKATVSFDQIVPAHFAELVPENLLQVGDASVLALASLPLEGRFNLVLDKDGTVEEAALELSGGEGFIDIPGPDPQTLPVLGLSLAADYAHARGDVRLLNAELDLFEGSELALDAVAPGYSIPTEKLTLRGRYDIAEDQLNLQQLKLDMAGPSIGIEVELDGLKAHLQGRAGEKPLLTGNVSALLTDFSMGLLPRFWPEGLSPDARYWTTKNIRVGDVPQASISIDLRGLADGTIEPVAVNGRIDLEGGEVDYLHPMPKAVEAKAYAIFNEKRFDITILEGKANGLKVTGGQIALLGIDGDKEYTEISLSIEGAIPDALRLIDNRPLGYATALGLSPDRTQGYARTKLKLEFPLIVDLKFDQVEVSARADLTEAVVDDVLWGRGISADELELLVNAKGLDLTGEVLWGGIPLEVAWRENFSTGPAFRSRYDLKAQLDDIRRLKDLGLDVGFETDDYVSGSAEARIGVTVLNDNETWIETKADLTNLDLRVPEVALSKPAGTPATAEAALSLRNGLVAELPLLTLTAPGIELRGSADYDEVAGTGLERLDIERLSFGRNDLKAVLLPGEDGGWTISAHGASADLSPLFDDESKAPSEPGTPSADDGLRVSVSVNLDQVWVKPEQKVENVNGTLVRDDGKWRTANLGGVTAGNQGFFIKIEPVAKDRRKLLIQAQDAGGLLRTLDLYPHMLGGDFRLEGVFDDALPKSPLTARLQVGDFRIVEAPALAHMVSLMALTGILESLQGDGLAFSELDLPVVYTEDEVVLTDGRVAGLSLGFTLSGRYYAHADMLSMEGTVVPAYALNSVLGRIPILGNLITGGEKGSGLFAANYSISGPVEDPEVSVNALSALTPGFMRRLFGIFDGPEEPIANVPPERLEPLPDIQTP